MRQSGEPVPDWGAGCIAVFDCVFGACRNLTIEPGQFQSSA
jgi:hypothetical protein